MVRKDCGCESLSFRSHDSSTPVMHGGCVLGVGEMLTHGQFGAPSPAAKQLQDQDRTSIVAAGVPQSHDIGHLNSHQFTQELRIASPSEGFLTYVAGL